MAFLPTMQKPQRNGCNLANNPNRPGLSHRKPLGPVGKYMHTILAGLAGQGAFVGIIAPLPIRGENQEN